MSEIICKDKELDYFILESMPNDGSGTTIEGLLALGMETYFIFNKNGSFQAKIFGNITAGKWNETALTAGEGDEATSLKYTLDGDLLKMNLGSGEMTFKRSGDTPPDFNAVLEPDSGKIIETSFTDLKGKNCVMSVVCPDGWYNHTVDFVPDKITFKASPSRFDTDCPSVAIYCYAKLPEAYSVSRNGEPVSFTVNGKVWEGVYDKCEKAISLFTEIDGNIADINSTGIEPDSDIFQQVLNSFNLVWE